MIGTLQDCIKDEFTDKVKKSWLKLFNLLVYHMIEGMNQAQKEGDKRSEMEDAASPVASEYE